MANAWGGKQGGGQFQPSDFFALEPERPAGNGHQREAPPELIAAAWESYFADVAKADRRRFGLGD